MIGAITLVVVPPAPPSVSELAPQAGRWHKESGLANKPHLMISITDVIEMSRILQTYSSEDRVAVFSPDGTKFAAVVWRGEIPRNKNIYSLLVFDATRKVRQNPDPIISIDFDEDPDDQKASPFSKLRFLPDNRTLAFIGRLDEKVPQVYALDSESGETRKLTDHKTRVRSFGLRKDASLAIFSADGPEDSWLRERLDREGLSISEAVPSESALFGRATGLAAGFWARPDRQWFQVSSHDSKSALIHEASSGIQISSLSVAPSGEYALIWPFENEDHFEAYSWTHYADKNPYYRSLAAPFGLVDLTSGVTRPLLKSPHVVLARNVGPAVWLPDSRSVVVSSLLPLDMPGAERSQPQLVEVEIDAGRVTSLGVGEEWSTIGWDPTHNALLLQSGTGISRRDGPLARLPRLQEGWGVLSEMGKAEGLNGRYPIATNGSLVVGVTDDLVTPPDIATYDLDSREISVVTDLNPKLRDRRYGEVEKIFWEGPAEKQSFGYLIRPIDYDQGTRYPLALLLKDEAHDPDDDSFLIDGQAQLSGYAIQTLSSCGIMVLFTPFPPWLREVVETHEESAYMVRHVEAAIAHLDSLGRIDANRVALSGWSRAAYHTNKVIMLSDHPFAAATQIDGGMLEYVEDMRPFTHDELQRITTPLLIELHGKPSSLGLVANFFDQLEALNKPVELFWYPMASHSTKTPAHRWTSLSSHVDWFRFWLQDYEDPDPTKVSRYRRWRELREKSRRH